MTAVTHAVIGFAVGASILPRSRTRQALWAVACCGVIPDIDLAAPYFGGDRDFHRRFTHSILFAVIVGLSFAIAGRLARRSGADSMRLGGSAALAILSHALSDMLTTYRLGVALMSPVSATRYELPWHPIAGIPSEFLFVFLPAVVIGLSAFRRRQGDLSTDTHKRAH